MVHLQPTQRESLPLYVHPVDDVQERFCRCSAGVLPELNLQVGLVLCLACFVCLVLLTMLCAWRGRKPCLGLPGLCQCNLHCCRAFRL